MSSSDWRSASAYEYLQDLNSSGLAWEFLRRNQEYRADYTNHEFRAALDAGVAGRERRWGLRFRG
jgi:hypothetical protein